jgi:hypothetical protein
MVFLLIKFFFRNYLSGDYRDSTIIATTPFSSFVVPVPGMGVISGEGVSAYVMDGYPIP